jgi:NNP family nitrate/nitrite transporter-like MFS transporter
VAAAAGRALAPASRGAAGENAVTNERSSVIKGSPRLGLIGATAGFFVGFAAVALFGPTALRFRDALGLSPLELGFLISMPALSGSLLRIPFSAWVDTTGGRKPFLVLLGLSIAGMAGVAFIVSTREAAQLTPGYYWLFLGLGALCGSGIATFSVGISQVAYWFPQTRQGRALAVYAGVGNLAPGLFSVILPFALQGLGLAFSYVAWLAFLAIGTAAYWALGRNAWFFQLREQGWSVDEATARARSLGQELFPARTTIETLKVSATVWQTWGLVAIYFTTFGGFVALTAWLPTYWMSFFGVSVLTAGLLTALYSLTASVVRILGGVMADRLYQGGQNTGVLSLLIMLSGALLMSTARDFELAIPGVLLLAVGMGICNAATFKILPQAVPGAVGGAAGWVGGLGAFGGFLIPPALAFAVSDLGQRGYAIGFIVFVVLALGSMSVMWVLKYGSEMAQRESRTASANLSAR